MAQLTDFEDNIDQKPSEYGGDQACHDGTPHFCTSALGCFRSSHSTFLTTPSREVGARVKQDAVKDHWSGDNTGCPHGVGKGGHELFPIGCFDSYRELFS